VLVLNNSVASAAFRSADVIPDLREIHLYFLLDENLVEGYLDWTDVYYSSYFPNVTMRKLKNRYCKILLMLLASFYMLSFVV
jgi:hypothetical protein